MSGPVQAGAASCTPCPVGQHAEQIGQAACAVCPAGQYAPTKGTIYCIGAPSIHITSPARSVHAWTSLHPLPCAAAPGPVIAPMPCQSDLCCLYTCLLRVVEQLCYLLRQMLLSLSASNRLRLARCSGSWCRVPTYCPVKPAARALHLAAAHFGVIGALIGGCAAVTDCIAGAVAPKSGSMTCSTCAAGTYAGVATVPC